MSDELRLPDELAAVEARLAAKPLAAIGINRDELMYRAGWAAGAETARLAGENPPPLKGGVRGGIRIAAWSAASAAVAAALAVFATLLWRPTEVMRVAIQAPAQVSPEEVKPQLLVDRIAPATVPSPEKRAFPALDVGLLALRRQALTDGPLGQGRVASVSSGAATPVAKTARELLHEMLPGAKPHRTSAWPWEKNLTGDSI